MNPFEEQVRTRAYYIWIDEGRVIGRADDHWLRAEGEMWAQASTTPVRVQTTAPDLTLSPSPAEILDKPLKAKTGRAKTVAKADLLAEVPAPKAAKPAARARSAKTTDAAAKATETKTSETKTAATKTTGTKSAGTKAAAAETTPKPAATKPVRARASRAAVPTDATVH